METDIIFVFEGKKYTVGIGACNKDIPIKLPDGRMLNAVNGWTESIPSLPIGGLKVISPDGVVESLDAVEASGE
jgi:hypothetical protein